MDGPEVLKERCDLHVLKVDMNLKPVSYIKCNKLITAKMGTITPIIINCCMKSDL